MKVKILLLLVVVSFLAAPFKGKAQAANKKDSLALVDFYDSTGGPHWMNNAGWLHSEVKNWFGITLDADGYVTSILLTSNSLKGTIPASIGNFSRLSALRVAGNSLKGKVPSSLSNLTNLTILRLSNNNLEGPVPSLSKLTKLQSLILAYNNFNFSGLEDIEAKFSFALYAPQNNLTLSETAKTFAFSAGGTVSNNTYKWYKGTVLMATKTGDSTYTPVTGGYYRVEVTNTHVPGLTLISDSAIFFNITSFSPASGTYRTPITIKGIGFSGITDATFYDFAFNNVRADSAAVISDTEAVAWVGAGASGNVQVREISLPGFTYIPATVPANSGWHYVGAPKVTVNAASFAGGIAGPDNLPVVTYLDSTTGKAMAVKLTANGTYQQLGPAISDGAAKQPVAVLDHANNPIVSYIDPQGYVIVKKFDGANWNIVGQPAFSKARSIDIAIDTNDVLYVMAESYIINVFKLDGSSWIKTNKDGFAESTEGYVSIAINKTNNMPYILFDDVNQQPIGGAKATVMSYDGTTWANVGNPGFSTGIYGMYYGNIAFDEKGNPMVFVEDDDGFERGTLFKFVNGFWQTLGSERFTRSHTYRDYFSVTPKGDPYVIFVDVSYNNRSSIMRFNKTSGTWEYAGAQGCINTHDVQEKSLFIGKDGIPWIAYSNLGEGNGLSVMRLNTTTDTTIQPAHKATQTASYETTGSDGWTNYYYDNNTPSNLADDTLLLSLKKNGQNIGTIGDGTFAVKLVATAGAGSNKGIKLTSPLITNNSGYYVMNRYWQVTATHEPTASVGVRFYYNNQDLKDVNGSYPAHNLTNNKLIFYKAVGGNPDPTSNLAGAAKIISIMPSDHASDTTWTYHTLSDTTQYGEYSVASFSGGGGGGTGNNLALPVTLLNFTATRTKTDVQLAWQTAQEVNAATYFVERSINGSDFTGIGSVQATGNSSVTQAYSYVDYGAAALNTQTLYYRLKITDRDGNFSYSKIISLAQDDVNKAALIYPNPAHTSASIQFTATAAKKYVILVTATDGKVVKRINIAATAGVNRAVIDIHDLPQAAYNVTITSNKDNKTFKLVKE